jgi:Na+/alanine symporter
MEAGFELFLAYDSVGCKRGIYSNEAAGQSGTAPHIAAAANVSSHQTRFSTVILGLYRYFISVFGLLIYVADHKYNVQNPC